MDKDVLVSLIDRETLIGEITEKVLKGIENILDKKVSGSAEEKQFYTIKECSTLLRVSQTTIYDWLNKGILERKKVGNRTLIPKSSIQAAIKDVESV